MLFNSEYSVKYYSKFCNALQQKMFCKKPETISSSVFLLTEKRCLLYYRAICWKINDHEIAYPELTLGLP